MPENVRLRLIDLNAVQKLLYQQQPVWVLIWFNWMQSKDCYINTSPCKCWYESPWRSWSGNCFVWFHKTKHKFVDFLMLFVTLLYFSRCDREQISVLLYCIKTMGSRWHHVSVCFSSSGRTIVILKLSQLHQIYFHLRNCPMYVACCQA